MELDNQCKISDIALTETLLLAVPMWMERVKTYSPKHRELAARECADAITSHGDALMFKGKTKSARQHTTDAFNALAQGLAIGAYQPGGVTFKGYHWCVEAKHLGVNLERITVEHHSNGPCDESVINSVIKSL